MPTVETLMWDTKDGRRWGNGRGAKKMAKDAILGFLQADDGITDSHEFTAVDGVDHTELENVIKGLNGFEVVEANAFQSPNPGLY